MPFTRFVEVGRVALINYGKDTGKLCVILETLDQNRCLVDGPSTITGVNRQQMNFKWLALTSLKVTKLCRGAPLYILEKLFKEQDIMGMWAKTSWAKKLAARKRRASLTDFERFKTMCLRKKRSAILRKEREALKKATTAK